MIKKLAITAFALSMTAAFAGTPDKSTTTSSTSAQPSMSMETPKNSMTSSSSSADSSQVKQVQQALKDKGQDPGAIDGKMGPKTTAALQSFQQAQGITGSGLDQPTLAALGVSGDASASASGSLSSTQPSASSNQPAASANQPAAASSSNQPSSTTQSSSTNATKQ